MTGLTPALIAGALVFAAVAAGMAPLLRLLKRRQVLDRPNERSSHKTPTPVGGGIAVMAALLPAWAWLTAPPAWHLILPAAALAALSLADDLKGLSAAARLCGHVLAVAVVLYLQPGLAGAIPDAVPRPAAFASIGIAWVWFINLFNFMDGIDGITGVETATIGLGVLALAALGQASPELGGLGLAAAAAAAGFLAWNWHPAKIFMGDVGSVPLGFLLGWLLLALAAEGAWPAALILPAYYLADTTLTLLRRLFRGEAVWRAHRQHFYQMPVIAGRGHAWVAGRVLAAGLTLIAFAALVPAVGPAWALAGAAAVVAATLAAFARARPRGA